MDEVRLAVEKGYRILEIYVVYEYRVTRYDPTRARAACSWNI
jgi:hypothetical protein